MHSEENPTPTSADGLISGDDHIDLAYMPLDTWQSRVATKWRADAPVVTGGPDGNPIWVREGRPWGPSGSKKVLGRKVPYDLVGLSEEAEPGVFRATTAKYRLADMDSDGVYAQVLYNFLDWSFEDQELKAACLEAFNSWLAEFCATDPNRLVGLAVLPAHDPLAAQAELARVTELGLRGAVFDVFEAAIPIHDQAWDPLWEMAASTGTAISVHIGMGGAPRLARKAPLSASADPGRTWKLPASAAVTCLSLAWVLSEVIFSGLFERHPSLRFVLGESSIGWIPFVLERLDFEHENYGEHIAGLPSSRPSDLFRRNVWCTFQDEKLGVEWIPLIGEDNVMWASDYPHGDGTFPHTRQRVAQIFADASPVVTAKATRDNARQLYRIE